MAQVSISDVVVPEIFTEYICENSMVSIALFQSSEIIHKFKLGFANRTLGYRLPAKNRAAGAESRIKNGRRMQRALRLQRPGSLEPASAGSASGDLSRNPRLSVGGRLEKDKSVEHFVPYFVGRVGFVLAPSAKDRGSI